MVADNESLEQGWYSEFRRALHDSPFPINDPAVLSAWDALECIRGTEASDIRRDFCGALVKFEHYGNTDSDYGWTIRRATYFNLRKFRFTNQWRACHVRNGKNGHFLVCAVTSENSRNVDWDIRAPLVFFPRN